MPSEIKVCCPYFGIQGILSLMNLSDINFKGFIWFDFGLYIYIYMDLAFSIWQ
jgi:hypothetical protein